MSINVSKILRAPEPGDAANGGGNGAGTAAIPRGPLSKSLLEEVLEGRDPLAAKVIDPAKTPSTDGQEGGGEQPGGEPQPGEGGEPGGEEPQPGDEGGGEAGGGDAGGERQLDEATQGHLTELAEMLARGELSVGEVKRIKKLLQEKLETGTALNDLRDQVADLTAKLNAKDSGPAQPAEANPFTAMVKNETDLGKAKRDMYDIIEWAEDNAEGGQRNGKEFTAEEVKQLRREARRALDIHLPAMERQLQAGAAVAQSRTKMRTYMKTNHAEFYDRESGLGQLAEQFRQDPIIANRADGDVIAAAMALGMTELKRRETAKKNGNGKANGSGTLGTVVQRKTGGLPPGPGGNGARVTPGAVKQMQSKVSTAIQSGRREDFAAALEAMGPPGRGPTRHRPQ